MRLCTRKTICGLFQNIDKLNGRMVARDVLFAEKHHGDRAQVLIEGIVSILREFITGSLLKIRRCELKLIGNLRLKVRGIGFIQ